MLRRHQSILFRVAAISIFILYATVWTVRRQEVPLSVNFIAPSKLVNFASQPTKPEREVRTVAQAPIEASPKVLLTEGSSDNLKDVQNATLGFQKIYVLSMSTRSDKRDAIALSAYLSGLEIEFIEGINGSMIHPKAYPQNWRLEEPAGTIGCWRGHMDIYQKMVLERIQSVLILEDDIDWDVMIKAQMTELARGTRYLQRAVSPMHSPYGDKWDLITTGHCGVWNKVGDDQDYWVIDNDPTVVLPETREWWRKPDLSPPLLAGNRTRLVFSPYKLSCTASYAISLQGATRMLYDQAILPNAKGIDTSLGAFCKRQEYGFYSCLAAYPMITGVHLPAGDMTRESDRKKIAPGRIRKVAMSHNLVYSIRLNIDRLLRGETIIKAQHPEVSMLEEIDVQTLKLPTGKGVFVKKEDYAPKVEEEATSVAVEETSSSVAEVEATETEVEVAAEAPVVES